MAQVIEVKIPEIGDSDAVDVVEVLVQPGDQVEAEASLISLESDKATMDVPSPQAGTIKELRVEVGAQVKEGDVIALLEAGEGAAEATPPAPASQAEAPKPEPPAAVSAPEPEPAPEPALAPRPDPPAQAAPAGAAGGGSIDEASFARAYASPAVRLFARELGVDLGKVQGTGRKGRILKTDVQAFVKQALNAASSVPAGGGGGFSLPPMPEIDFSKFGPVEVQPLSRIQKLSAANLHRSWIHVPRVTQHDEADITEMDAFRKGHAERAKAAGFKLTPVAFLLKAAAAALAEHPRFNSSLAPDGESIIVKGYFHLGVAVDTPGGLVVPVIRDVDRKGVFELAEELGAVSKRARDGRLKLDDLQGATFTISSLGGIGGTAFTPIVNAPEVGILGVSRAARKPVWNGEGFEPRLMLPLSLSYDHRVIDGAAAARFITHLSWLLSDTRRLLL